jgi:hypothetical protein
MIEVAAHESRLFGLYLFQMNFEDAGSHRVVALEFRTVIPKEHIDTIIHNLGAAVSKHLSNGETIDFCVLQDDIRAAVIKQADAIFTR